MKERSNTLTSRMMNSLSDHSTVFDRSDYPSSDESQDSIRFNSQSNMNK